MGMFGLFEEELTVVFTAIVAIVIAAFVFSFLKEFFAGAPRQHYQQIPDAAARLLFQPPPQRQPPPQPTTTTIRTLTISIPGVLLEERKYEELSDGATLLPDAVAALRIAALHAEVFLLCQVADDVGEAAVRGALEFCGMLGPEKDQIRPQRLLFCSTSVGKASLVRQLEPDAHIDGNTTTIQELQRFIPKLVEIAAPGRTFYGDGTAAENIQSASTLHDALIALKLNTVVAD